jgi:hypothetical protein
MSTDLTKRIEALKVPPPAPPTATPPIAALSPDEDPRRLLPILVDLAAEFRQISIEARQAATDNARFLARMEAAVPTTFRQVVREELLPMRSQLADHSSRVETLGAHVSRVVAACGDVSGTLRGLCVVLIAIGLGIAAAFIKDLC